MGLNIDLLALDDLSDQDWSNEGWVSESKRVPLGWLMLFEEKSLAFPWVTDGGHKIPVLHTERLPAIQR